jgi:outer membrane receptor protein involved in Fe transport
MLIKAAFLAILGLVSLGVLAQSRGGGGILAANVMDESRKGLEGASAELVSLSDTSQKQSVLTDKDGGIFFRDLKFGVYRLRISYVGFQTLSIDSINFREDRSDFNLNDLILHPRGSSNLSEIIVYAEKPLVQSKDGNITFNAAESALSAGSSASDLLANVPLVNKDPDGKISVRGREPKILIDDKPVELNLQQLQDLLESMPGSSIEKIEVMTNPPPQYANEQGGVINIVLRKGSVGRSGRINVSAGSRGEASASGNYSYRKSGLSLSINGGVGYGRYSGYGHSSRENIYLDSSNYFNTNSSNWSRNLRPNFRTNLDYDLNKYQSLNLVFQFNSNRSEGNSNTTYTNLDRTGQVDRLSNRNIGSNGNSYFEALNLAYTLKSATPGEQLRIIVNNNLSQSTGDRNFYQQYFNPDHSFNGIDSTQNQNTINHGSGHLARVDYDRPLSNKKTFLSLGSFYSRSNSAITVDADYLHKPDSVFVRSDLLSNDFRFHQTVVNFRGSLRQLLAPNFSITGGLSAERTAIWFELLKDNRDARNSYWTWLPFANINKNWQDKLNITLSWRRSIRRPGINELNPTIDFSDPYNVRFGNERLKASTADNFDLVIGRTRPKYFINLGTGYNIVRDIFSRVRTLMDDGRTQITWENISGRKEYELSTWGGLTLTRKFRVNLSASYTYNQYSLFDRIYNRYRNGGSFTSNVNSTFSPRDVWNFTGSFTFNRFANPQGYARWNWSMNTGIQRKFFGKKLVVTFNMIDVFSPQRNRSYTYGPNFYLQSFSTTNTRNFRLSIGYNLSKTPPRKPLQLPMAK